ncbi:hypothetical protein BDR07DRAFT_1455447 [Suillus spraguei]|nr:hypothetical protein BDR07DRAFT_1455447 [Suillus spraguei]
MFAIFKKSSIFITVCRHGFLLTICDMVRSGELLANYEVPYCQLKEANGCLGAEYSLRYDIKCAFEKIILRSSLADDVKRLNIQGVVPAFHGHAHNRLCQEDFETCERTRNATEFHRHQALDEHF